MSEFLSASAAFLKKPLPYRSVFVARTILLCTAALIMVGIILVLKSLSIIRFDESPLLHIYALTIFLFQLTRLVLALLYRSVVRDDYTFAKDVTRYEPTASFIIPSYNEEAVIYENIAHCYDVDYPASKIEVIAVNDGSKDNTLQEMKRAQKDFPSLKIINFKQNKGKRAGMAAAIKKATGEIVIQLDSDSYIAADDFRKLLVPFADDDIAAVCAHADPTNKDKNLLTKAQAGYYFMAFRVLKAAESTFNFVLCCSGCCSAYRRSVIAPLIDEFANESFLGVHVNFGDDRSLTNLILRNGKKTVYVNNVQAYTIVPETLRQLLKQQTRWKKSWFINTVKASKYVWKRDMFISLTYFFPLAFITLMTPFIAFYGLIISPLVHHTFPIYFLAGSVLVTLLFAIVTVLLAKDNRHWYYLLVWGFINTFMLAFLLPYSLLTIRNNKWGTR